jgi:hypothetical protein
VAHSPCSFALLVRPHDTRDLSAVARSAKVEGGPGALLLIEGASPLELPYTLACGDPSPRAALGAIARKREGSSRGSLALLVRPHDARDLSAVARSAKVEGGPGALAFADAGSHVSFGLQPSEPSSGSLPSGLIRISQPRSVSAWLADQKCGYELHC